MNSVLIISYTSLIAISSLILSLVIKYLREKPKNKTFIRDQILIDLAIISELFVFHFSAVFIIREFFGKFQNPLYVDVVYYIQQTLFDCLLVCTVSLQLFQVLSIFQTAALSEWREYMVVSFHRLFVLALGVPFGILICYSGGGMCRPAHIYFYLLQVPAEKEKSKASFFSVISVTVFVVIIICCQVAVEIKRFLMIRAEEKAEQLAVHALKEIREARMRLNSFDLGVLNPPVPARQAWVDVEVSNSNDFQLDNKSTNPNQYSKEQVKQSVESVNMHCYFLFSSFHS
jgi:hypothetical protein